MVFLTVSFRKKAEWPMNSLQLALLIRKVISTKRKYLGHWQAVEYLIGENIFQSGIFGIRFVTPDYPNYQPPRTTICAARGFSGYQWLCCSTFTQTAHSWP
jgi:hypothetical protein